jgi:hypothetical protein
MPKQRQRIVFCDCLDCLEAPARPTDVPSALPPAGEAAARQDPPPKSLVLLLTGALRPLPPGGASARGGSNAEGVDAPEQQQAGASGGGGGGGGGSSAAPPTTLEAARVPHLDRAARGGCLSFLTWREGSAAGGEAAGGSGEGAPPAALAELAQLLGVYEVRHAAGGVVVLWCCGAVPDGALRARGACCLRLTGPIPAAGLARRRIAAAVAAGQVGPERAWQACPLSAPAWLRVARPCSRRHQEGTMSYQACGGCF